MKGGNTAQHLTNIAVTLRLSSISSPLAAYFISYIFKYMSFFFRRRTSEELLDSALGKILEAQARQIETMSDFLTKMSELSAKRAAQALGSRGGRKRAANAAAARKVSRETSYCRLCLNPSITNPTVGEIMAHNAHEHSIPEGTLARPGAPEVAASDTGTE